MAKRYRALIICFMLVAVSGCASNGHTTPVVPGVIAGEILIALINDLIDRYPPATTTLTLLDESPIRGLEDTLRNQGYAVHLDGDQNPVSIRVYYLEEEGLYLGVLRVGIEHTLSRKYVWDNGQLQAGATTVASTDG